MKLILDNNITQPV